MISIILNLRFVLCPIRQSILMNIPCAVENAYSAVDWLNSIKMSIILTLLMTLHILPHLC